MIRLATIAVLGVLTLASAKTGIDLEIEQTNRQLKNFNQEHSSLNAKMADNARAILEQKKTLLEYRKEIAELEAELKAKEDSYRNDKAELELLKGSQEELTVLQTEIEQGLVFAIARNASLMLLLEDRRSGSADALITESVLNAMLKQSREEIRRLNANFDETGRKIEQLKERTGRLRESIALIDTKRQHLIASRKKSEKSLEILSVEKQRYARSVDDLLDRQESLKKTLAELNIIKVEELKKLEQERQAKLERERRQKEARARAQSEQARKAAEARAAALEDDDLPQIKKQSIYHNVKTKRYRGQKTIAPLDGYQVVKRFGPYTDPIYNIKIFNESVSLKPKQNAAKVKNVLNGRVVLATKTPMLDNVVIVEHSDGLHTIYAHLDQIAPTIKKGQKIKKGYVIGRVDNELMFEVTQQNYHIDPLHLIN